MSRNKNVLLHTHVKVHLRIGCRPAVRNNCSFRAQHRLQPHSSDSRSQHEEVAEDDFPVPLTMDEVAMPGANGPLAHWGTLSWKRTLGRMYGPPCFTLGKSCNVSSNCGGRRMVFGWAAASWSWALLAVVPYFAAAGTPVLWPCSC